MKDTRVKILVYTLTVFFIIILQSTVLNYVRILNVKPNLLLVFVVSTALLYGDTEGAVVGFFAGLVQDMLFGEMLGFYALLGLYTGFAIGSLNRKLYRDNLLVVTFITFISTIVYECMVFFLKFFGAVFSGEASIIFALRGIIVPEAIYNSAFSIVVYILAAAIAEKLDGLNKAVRKY